MKRITLHAVWIGFALCVSVASSDEPQLLDNFYLEASGGSESSSHGDTGGAGMVGFNWGIPLGGAATPAFGLQVGGDVKLTGDSPAFNATAGPFLRHLPSFGDETSALALLLDYQNTENDSDLFALRPIVGTTLGKRDALGLTATIGLNDESRRRGNVSLREDVVDRVEVFWNRDLTERLAAELTAGYQLGDVDAVLFGPQLAFSLTRHLDLGAGALVNTDGDYAWMIRTSWHFGGTGRHASLHNVDGKGTTLYTPFPKRQYADLLRDVDRSPIGAGGAGIGADQPGVTPGGGGSASGGGGPPSGDGDGDGDGGGPPSGDGDGDGDGGGPPSGDGDGDGDGGGPPSGDGDGDGDSIGCQPPSCSPIGTNPNSSCNPARDPGCLPPGQNPDFVPPGQNPDFIPPGQIGRN